MSNDRTEWNNQTWGEPWGQAPIIVPEIVDEPVELPPPPRRRRRRVWLPVLLFVATCVSTFFTGLGNADISRGWPHALLQAFTYAGCLMTILGCHEMGHFLQARRHGVYATLPFFLPMPFTPIGTLGAVIAMEAHRGDRKALFDIGIAGPLAGLVPTILFCVLGIRWSELVIVPPGMRGSAMSLGEPILFQLLTEWIRGPVPKHLDLLLHPMAYAGWVGLLITSLNLIPIGQLDGGHILYGLLRRKAHVVATLLLLAAIVLVTMNLQLYYGWLLMLFLLILMGPAHPPTANDDVPLGIGRIILGWLTLAFIPIGFTPTPFVFGH